MSPTTDQIVEAPAAHETITLGGYKIHFFADIFLEMNDEDYRALRLSIQKYGLLEPITILEGGWILDGKHRARACSELGVEPRTVEARKREYQDFPVWIEKAVALHARMGAVLDRLQEETIPTI